MACQNSGHENESARIGREDHAVCIRRNRRAGADLQGKKHFETKCERAESRDTTRKARYCSLAG
jgi:hypothetical protein